jgi:hypothetical protein
VNWLCSPGFEELKAGLAHHWLFLQALLLPHDLLLTSTTSCARYMSRYLGVLGHEVRIRRWSPGITGVYDEIEPHDIETAAFVGSLFRIEVFARRVC